METYLITYIIGFIFTLLLFGFFDEKIEVGKNKYILETVCLFFWPIFWVVNILTLIFGISKLLGKKVLPKKNEK